MEHKRALLALFSFLWLLSQGTDCFSEEAVELKNGRVIKCDQVVPLQDSLKLILHDGEVTVPKGTLADRMVEKYFPRISSSDPTDRQGTPRGPAEAVALPINSLPNYESFLGCDSKPEDLPAFINQETNEEAPRFKIKEVQFDLTKFGDSKQLRVQCYVPMSDTGVIPDSASDIVFYAPFVGYTQLFPKEKGGKQSPLPVNKMLRRLAEVRGMTVFTILFPATSDEVDDRQKCYYYPESGSYQIVSQAWQKIVKDFRLNRNRKLYVFGLSGGSSMAERLGLLFPDKIAAVAMIGAGRLQQPVKKVDVPFLILHVRGDPRTAQNIELSRRMWALGMNALYAEVQPDVKTRKHYAGRSGILFHHEAIDFAFHLCEEYIAAIRQLSSGPVGSPHQTWPSAVTISSLFTPIDQSRKGPIAGSVPLPSERFSRLWQSIPYRRTEVSYTDKAGTASKVTATLRYPVSPTIKGVVVLNTGISVSSADQGDLMDYVASEQYVCIIGNFSDGEAKRCAETKALVEWMHSLKVFQTLPIKLIGFGTGGRHMLLATGSFQGNRKLFVFTYKSSLTWPFPELSPLDVVRRGRLKGVFLLGQHPDDGPDPEAPAFLEAASQQGILTRVVICKDGDERMEYFDALDVGLTN